VDAYTVRPDGIVLLDSSLCIGCGYCAWACPYGVPQFDPSAGTMSKCNFCFDNLDAGLPPACTAACPMRVLDYGEAVSDGPTSSLALWETPAAEHPFPLPDFSRTRPHLAVTPHPAMSRPEHKSVMNWEEVKPQRHSGWEEIPLVAFTILAQMAVGGFWAMSWMFTPFWLLIETNAAWLRLLPSLLVGLSFALGMAASFMHLGAKKNAWRAVTHLRKSWLSREILLALLFGLVWLLSSTSIILWHRAPPTLFWLTALLGLSLIYSMSRVYRLRAVSAWNTPRTEVSFFLSALLLGQLLMSVILAFESQWTGVRISTLLWRVVGFSSLIFLVVRSWITYYQTSHSDVEILWRFLLVAGSLVTVIAFFVPGLNPFAGSLSAFIILLVEETVGRWLFYASRP
jgi:DMSO reductase anchor subunit